MKNFKKAVLLLSMIVTSMTWSGCQNKGSDAGDSKGSEQTDNEGIVEKVKEFVMPDTEVLPAGTKVPVRLGQAISSDTNKSGDEFLATLDSDLTVNGKTLAPAGTKVVGELPTVKESGRVKGRAELQLTLRELIINGSEYDLETHPLTIQAEGSEEKDAATIAGGAVLGAIIGAISDGGKGAAIGAGVGGGSGVGYVLATKGKKVEFGPETRFEFTLSKELKIPVG